jgi:hypothetical protein
MNSSILWDKAQCRPLKVNRRFKGTYRFHLQCQRINQERNQHESRYLLHAGFFLGLFFEPENGGDMFL